MTTESTYGCSHWTNKKDKDMHEQRKEVIEIALVLISYIFTLRFLALVLVIVVTTEQGEGWGARATPIFLNYKELVRKSVLCPPPQY